MANNFTNKNTDTSAIRNLTKFYGYYDNVYKDPFINGNAFIFVTKPLLFLDPIKPQSSNSNAMMAYINMTRDPKFTQFIINEQLNQQDRILIESLSYNTDYSSSSFLPIFTNECKNFDSSDITMEITDIFETKQGFRQPLPTYTTSSESTGNISISVTEDSNLDFTKMMTLWVNYIKNITDGTFDANPEMVLNGALDYTSSIYYFVLDPDGKTLKYWAKYTGCWPMTIPYGGFRYNKGAPEAAELTLQFSYSAKEDMDPKILEDFNILSLKLMNTSITPTEIGGLYTSISDSPLLNLDKLRSIGSAAAILNSAERDPLILYRPSSKKGLNADSKNARFELYFDDYGYQSELISSVMDGDKNYYINDSASNEYAKGSGIVSWDQSGYWDN